MIIPFGMFTRKREAQQARKPSFAHPDNHLFTPPATLSLPMILAVPIPPDSPPAMPKKLRHTITVEVIRARQHLLATGWSYRAAATALGCSFTQLSHVLTGRRRSRSLVSRILALPLKPHPDQP